MTDQTLYATLGPGDLLFEEGQEGADMFIIERGDVELVRRVDGEERPLAVLGEGEFFGEMSMLEGLPRVASARARSDCRLLKIDRDAFEALIASRPDVAVQMLRRLSERLREFYERERDMPAPSALAAETATGERAPQRSVHLVHSESGRHVDLPAEGDMSVGRADVVTGRVPDLDLTELDKLHSVSRLHAKILRRNGLTFVVEESASSNGTFVDGRRIEPGAVEELAVGTEVRFGLVTFELES